MENYGSHQTPIKLSLSAGSHLKSFYDFFDVENNTCCESFKGCPSARPSGITIKDLESFKAFNRIIMGERSYRFLLWT